MVWLVSGAGSLYFDMIKDNPWDIKQDSHSERSPKSQNWNSEKHEVALPPVPNGVTEVNEYAPF